MTGNRIQDARFVPFVTSHLGSLGPRAYIYSRYSQLIYSVFISDMIISTQFKLIKIFDELLLFTFIEQITDFHPFIYEVFSINRFSLLFRLYVNLFEIFEIFIHLHNTCLLYKRLIYIVNNYKPNHSAYLKRNNCVNLQHYY